MKPKWCVYILKCADNTLYTGVTTNLERRVVEHNAKKSITKYTRVRQPVELVYSEKCKNRSEATQKEAAIKKLSRLEKKKLIF